MFSRFSVRFPSRRQLDVALAKESYPGPYSRQAYPGSAQVGTRMHSANPASSTPLHPQTDTTMRLLAASLALAGFFCAHAAAQSSGALSPHILDCLRLESPAFALLTLSRNAVSNLETFPTVYPGTSTGPPASGSPSRSAPGDGSRGGGGSPSGTPFDPSNFPTMPGPAILSNMTFPMPTTIAATGSGSGGNGSFNSTTSRPTAVTASSVSFSSSAPAASVVTSTVAGSVTTMTITNSAAIGAARTPTGSGSGGSSGAGSSRDLGRSGTLGAVAVAVAVAAGPFFVLA